MRIAAAAYGIGAISVAVAGGLILKACRPEPNTLYSIAEMTNSDLRQFVVAQTHVDWVEGWDATFWLVDTNNRYFSFQLESETGRWRAAMLRWTNSQVAVFADRYVFGPRRFDLVGTFDPERRVFRNALKNYSTTNTEGSTYQTNPFTRAFAGTQAGR